MKNELECAYCLYRQVPEHFTPCLGCKYNSNPQVENTEAEGEDNDENK